RFSPLAEVGGDFADFFTLPNGLIGLYIGDVVGKGLSAAMYASLVMGMMRGINKTGAEPADVLALLSRRIRVRPVTGRYCATLYALFDPVSNALKFANAGLPYPVLVSKLGVSQLALGGIPSGMFPGTTYEQHVVRLSPGDVVLFATDGLHEMRSPSGDDFSWKQLPETWSSCAQRSADEALEILFERVKHFSPHLAQKDDITAVALKVPVIAEKNDPPVAGDAPDRQIAEVAAAIPTDSTDSRRFR
ncbi:MAG TPA: PP2C family protein-serine/threonine phosphatase, partial [Candidatus Limnocylindria bacterium]|nr:PP2C family protein-serine/threonine phosphatase [Candidatus Limnocylindria bacterium]